MPPLYEERLNSDLERIRGLVAEVAAQVSTALKNSVESLCTMDRHLAYQTILGDHPINRATREIDRLCHHFVARHLPSAGHLRFISSVLRLSLELERLGDYAVTICRETVELSGSLEEKLQREVERMARDSFQMLEQATKAFNEKNSDLARGTMGYTYQVERSFSLVFQELVKKGQEGALEVKDLFAILVIFSMLERVSDQAKNICEETVFALAGERKQPKVYPILFLEKSDDCRSQLAVGIARKAYPNSGSYSSAGIAPAAAIDALLGNFMEEHGIPFEEVKPRPLDWVAEELGSFHVVVSLEGPVEDYLTDIPFNTAALEWSIPAPLAKDRSEEERRATFREIYQETSLKIRELIEILHGKEAS